MDSNFSTEKFLIWGPKTLWKSNHCDSLTHISRTGTFGQNDLLLSPPTSHCRQPHRSPNEHPPLRNASLALRFFLTININCYRSLLIFLFYYVYLFVYMWGGDAHACLWRAHTLCSDDSSHKLFLSCPLVGSSIKLRLSFLFGSVSICHLPGYLISPLFHFQHVC